MEIKHNFKVADEQKIRIPLDSGYYWGRGWIDQETANKWADEVYEKLVEAGYKLVHSDISGACPTLRMQSNPRAELYLHPMEFSGYWPKDEFCRLIHILEDCKTIHGIGTPDIQDVYDASDMEYINCLADNASEILKWMKELKEHNEYYDVGFEFAENYRIPRVGDPCVLCSDQKDVVFIEHFAKIAAGLGLI